MRFIFIALSLFLSAMVYAGNPETPRKSNISLGFLDDRTGLSFVGFTYNVIQKPQDEIYAGVGSLLAIFTASAGWKHRYAPSGSSFYHTIGIQAIAAMGGDDMIANVSLGYEKRFGERWSLRLGGLAIITFDRYDSVVPFPYLNLNYRF